MSDPPFIKVNLFALLKVIADFALKFWDWIFKKFEFIFISAEIVYGVELSNYKSKVLNAEVWHYWMAVFKSEN